MIGESLREYSELLDREREEFNQLKATVGVKIEKVKFKASLAEKNRDSVSYTLMKNQIKINMAHARIKELTHVIGNTRKNMAYVKKDLHKSHRMHSNLSMEVDTLAMITQKCHTYARGNLMKFNHILTRSVSANQSMDERMKVKKDPAEILAELEASVIRRNPKTRREELEMADKFKQRVLHNFEREGRAYMKDWIIRFSKKNEKQGQQVMDYMAKMNNIDNAFNTMKNSEREERIDELVKAVIKSYNENNKCQARLADIEGDMIQIEGKHNREQAELVNDLERISLLNSKRQVDEETRLRIEGLLRDDSNR